MGQKVPDWLRLRVWYALLGEVGPEMRLIALRWNDIGSLFLRFYIDREPLSEDFETVQDIAINIDTEGTGSLEQVEKIETEILFDLRPMSELDILDGAVYARRERERKSYRA